MAKGKPKQKRSSSKRPLSIVGTGGLLAGIGIGALEGWEQTKTLKGALVQSVYRLTGLDVINNKWDYKAATGGAIALGAIGLSAAGKKLRVNRYVPLPKGVVAF